MGEAGLVSGARDVAIGGLFLALSLGLPPLFHLAGLGSVFLPMLLPVATVGFVVREGVALVVGLAAPLVSTLITGMPPLVPPVAPLMSVELAVLALLPSLLYRRWRWNLMVVLVLDLLVNRGLVVGLRSLLAELFGIPGLPYGIATAAKGLPGIVLMLVAVPLAVRTVEKLQA